MLGIVPRKATEIVLTEEQKAQLEKVTRSWCISTDLEFTEKSAAIIVFYLNPLINPGLSVDEKPSRQVLERKTGYIETRDKTVVRAYKSTYKRHGPLNLFAALNIATGHIKAETTKTKTRDDFQAFMDSVMSDLPEDKDVHVILIITVHIREMWHGYKKMAVGYLVP
jgi:hypothetical protein